MEAEFFIHGPRHAFYGKPEESQYCQLFDNSQIKDEIRFIVEVRKGGNGELYTYYNYCRYTNILDVDGRSGAYIGLTVRLNAYYANLRNMYTVLEAIYLSRVVGLLVKKTPFGFQYTVADFKNSHQSILTNVEKNLGAVLMGIIAEDEVYAIDSSFSIGGKEITKGLDDNRYSLARLSDIKKSGKLIFASSKAIDLVEEMNLAFDHRTEALKEAQEKEIAQIKRSLDDAKEREALLKEDISKRTERILHLEEDIKNLEREKQSLSKGLEERDDRINQHGTQPSLLGSSGAIDKVQSSRKKESNGPRSKQYSRIDKISSKWSFRELGEGLRIGIFAFFLVTLIVGAILLFRNCSNSKMDKETFTEGDKNLSIPKSESPVNQCLILPNRLSNRVFPDCKNGNTSHKLDARRSELEPNKISLHLETPSIPITEYEWVIKNSRDILHNEKTPHNAISFSLENESECTIQVFVNDTLIVMKRIP